MGGGGGGGGHTEEAHVAQMSHNKTWASFWQTSGSPGKVGSEGMLVLNGDLGPNKYFINVNVEFQGSPGSLLQSCFLMCSPFIRCVHGNNHLTMCRF